MPGRIPTGGVASGGSVKPQFVRLLAYPNLCPRPCLPAAGRPRAADWRLLRVVRLPPGMHELAKLHLDYEKLQPRELEFVEKPAYFLCRAFGPWERMLVATCTRP